MRSVTICDISNWWMTWNNYVRMARLNPKNILIQRWAAKAQVGLVCAQALYWKDTHL